MSAYGRDLFFGQTPPSLFEVLPTFRVIAATDPYTTSRGDLYRFTG
jgi:hypothetical protein